MGYDRVMVSPHIDEARSEYLYGVQGAILEIGFGTGLNLPHYPDHVDHITTIDANNGMNAKANQQISNSTILVDNQVLNAENMPFESSSFDSVVSSYSLCSIEDVGQALSEIRRVLKPNGRFFSLEHGLSHDHCVQKWQHRLTPFQKLFADGCRLNRNISDIISNQGFLMERLKVFCMVGDPRTHGYTYQGIAVNPAARL